MNNIAVFESKELGCVLNAIMFNNEPAFEAVKVAEILGYANPYDAISQHCENTINLNSREIREFGLSDIIGNRKGVILIPESDLYSLIQSSKLESAKPFKRWVNKEVLPSIRKTGSYSVTQSPTSLATITNDTESAIKLANMFGITGNQALISADRVITKKHNFSPIKELGITLIAPSVEPLLTPTEIGSILGLTGQAVNKRLVELQMQEKIGGKWMPKLKGVDYAVMIDLEANGTRQQLKWKASVKDLLT
jgi:prophage antirepressor-like protein